MTKPLPPQPGPRDEINRIIIGLGGQGSRVVNEVRKAVQAHGPIPGGLEFIAIDSDRTALSNLDSIPEDQRVHLAAPDDNITETIVPWLPHEFRPKAGGGCGMQRLTGKAMYLVHKARIMEVVRDVARKVRQRTQVSDFMVVLVNAFGGGTGSGMAIDFSLDVRGEIKEITGQQPVMFGIGMLPSRAETIQRANGVAILKELHFLLSHKEPVVVGGRDYSSPFELYFLVGREVMGIERDEELLNSIVRFTLDLGLIPSHSREHSTAGKGAGWVDLQDIRTLVKGAGHMFSTFGHYRAVFPQRDLIDWFETLDLIAKLKKELPSLVTDLDAQRQKLEDMKIALAHDEQKIALARARAKQLRSEGVLGANRPELAKLLGEIAAAEEDIRKRRKEVQALDLDISTWADRRATLEKRLREAEIKVEELKQRLLAPNQTRTCYTVPLSEVELEYLLANRHLVTDGHFAGVMKALGRTPDYHDKTMEVVGKNKILYLPLLNYRMAFHTAASFPPAVLASLKKHGFVRFDVAGNPIVNEEHLWMVMAMLSSNAENIEPQRVGARAFKEVVEGHVARRAEAKVVASKNKPFEVVIHSWMVGVQVAPIAPGYPPRLKELEWLMPEYEQVAREGGLAQHHAFMYGDPLAFSQLSSTPIDRTSVSRTNQLVTKFWEEYAPIDAPARWMQLPPLLAEAHAATEELAKATTALVDTVDEFRTGEGSSATLDHFTSALTHGAGAIEAFARAFAEDVHPLKDRLVGLTTQIERTQQAPKDIEKLIAMEELAADAAAAGTMTSEALTQLRAELPEVVRLTLASAREAAPAADRARGAGSVRWAHSVAHAEAQATRLYQATGETLRHLEEMGRTLERIQSMLRARALAPLTGGISALDAASSPMSNAHGSPLADAIEALSAPAPMPAPAPHAETQEDLV